MRYLLEIGAFLMSQGQEPPGNSTVLAIVAETFPSVLSSISAPLVMSLPPIAHAVGPVALAALEDAMPPTLLSRRLTKAK